MTDNLSTLERSVPWPTNGDLPPSGEGAVFTILQWLNPSKDLIADWWSPARDKQLRSLVTQIDPLKIAVDTFSTKLVSIPFTISARDTTIKRHVRQAYMLQNAFLSNSDIAKGWDTFLNKFVYDWLTQDNGAFAIVMGRGKKNGPIVGPALGLVHLDSERCQRTGDHEFPVIYRNSKDHKAYKIHYTRLIEMSNTPSPDETMNGVGMCPVSNVIDAARELKDIAVNSQESFGSRPARRVLYVEEGAVLEQLLDAIALADQKMDSMGLTRFAKTLFLAPKTPTQRLKLNTLDLVGAPDNFNRMEVSLFDMAIIAAGFGLDLYDLAMAFGVRATEGVAEVQDRKGRGKGVGGFIEQFTKLLNFKALPPHLVCNFDNVDDQQDEHQAKIRDTRSSARERDLRSGVVSARVERLIMLRDDEITRSEFAEMELLDGRLPNGLDVFSLFVASDPVVTELLDLGVEEPTDIDANDPESMVSTIRDKIADGWIAYDNAGTARIANLVQQALAALERLQTMYEEAIQIEAEMMLEDVPADVDDVDADPEQLQMDMELEGEAL